MSCLVRLNSGGDLSPERPEEVLEQMGQAVANRVENAYVFRSAASGEI